MAPIDPTHPRTITVVLGVVVVAAVLVGGATGTTAFGSFNAAWDGTAELRSMADTSDTEVVVAEETTAYREVDPNGTVAVITRPGSYDESERARIRSFVENGGTLVVAARDNGTANPLLAALGTTARIDGAPLRDEREAAASPDFPVVTNTTDHPYVADAEGMALNHGSAIDPGNATVLARSSEFSYLDRTGDGEPSDGDELGAQPVVTIEGVGDGELLVVADPSVFINAMLERDGNRGFAAALLDAHDRLLLDQTTRGIPPLVAALLAIGDSVPIAVGTGLLLLGLVFAWERRVPARVWGRADGDERTALDGQQTSPTAIGLIPTDRSSESVRAQGVKPGRKQDTGDDRRG